MQYWHLMDTLYRHPLKQSRKAILGLRHDFEDLAELLKQTEGTGLTFIHIYEMLPTHGYPVIKNSIFMDILVLPAEPAKRVYTFRIYSR